MFQYIMKANLTDLVQVVFFTPGEIAAGGYGAYLTNVTITGLYAQEIKGAVVMVEREQLSKHSSADHGRLITIQTVTGANPPHMTLSTPRLCNY